MTPEELWKNAVGGHQRSWNELFGIFGSRLYQFFYKNTLNSELSMDKVQEVFIRLFRHRDAFHTGQLKTWIYRIARNLLIDEWRKKPRSEYPTDSVPDVPDASVSVEETAVKNLEHQQIVELIDEALPQMNENDRVLIGLVYLGGLSMSELASIMEIPLGTAKTRIRQARLRLDAMISSKIRQISSEREAI